MSAGRVRVLVLEGHDAAGKTTLAARLARELDDAACVRPFGGRTGARLLELAGERRHDALLEFAREAIQRAADREEGRLCIFDRHWMTVLSLLPPEHWDAWDDVPPTTLLWIDLETTLARLAARGDRHDADAKNEHRFYLGRYSELAERFGCPVLRTDRLSKEEASARLLSWAGRQPLG